MERSNMKLGFVSTYPPRACGIATFTQDLVRELDKVSSIAHPAVAAVSKQTMEYSSRVRMEIDQQNRESYLHAAYMLNRSPLDLVVVEHEYGIFGGQDGSYILDFAAALEKPLVTTLHTVLPQPSPNQRHIIQAMAQYSQRIVTMAGRSASLLESVYGVPSEKIAVIHHGVPLLRQTKSREELKKEHGLSGRTVLSTFGLLSPGKGIEYGIRAAARASLHHPDLIYLILGKTHPCVREQQGESYRQKLVQLVQELGVEDKVRFVNKYLSKKEIVDALCMSDIYMTPYLGRDQAVSGTLAYAAGYGRVILSTPYRYAEEMLADGRGLLSDFKDDAAMALHICQVIEHPEKKACMERKTAALGKTMLWDRVAQDYAALFRQILDEGKNANESLVG